MPVNGTEAATLSQIKEYVEYTQTQLEGYVDDAIVSQPPDVDIDQVYPVGSIYMSMSATSPSSLFGGTWERIQGRFLMASNSSYDAGDTGGSNDAIVVMHSHSASAENNGSHSHTISGGSHNHQGIAVADGSHSHPVNYSWNSGNASTGSDWRIVIQGKNDGSGSPGSATDVSRGVGNGGSHTHSLSISTSSSHSHGMSSSGTHGHNVNVFNVGSSGTNKNMPSFIAVNVWKRTA